MINCSICLDLPAFRLSQYINPKNGVYPLERRIILKTGGANRVTNGNRSIAVLSGLDGLESLTNLPYMKITPLESYLGYERQVEIDGDIQWGR